MPYQIVHHAAIRIGGSDLAKHVCGSCRFFDEARDGKHGWCTHPERRETSSVRILVRAAELRCRNDWGDDLWLERSANDLVLDVVMNDPAAPSPLHIERRQPPPEISPTFQNNGPGRIESAPLMSTDANADSLIEHPEAKTVSDDLNRELLRKAHDRIRERQRNKGYSVVPKREQEGEALVISNQYIPPSRDVNAPISRGLTSSVFEFGATSNDASFDDVPELAEPPSDLRVRQPVEPDPSRIVRRQQPAVRAQDPLIHELGVAPESFASAKGKPSWDDELDEPAAWSEPVERQPLRQSDLESWDLAVGEQEGETRPLWFDIPRSCQTCRDFRSAGNGQRGWCNNQWAFKHRRMVDADDIPCETSIGNWWLPGDEAWQGGYDISALGQPTPLMDKWFGRSTGEPAVDLPAERQRRRTGSW
jgi:hypothetical protein